MDSIQPKVAYTKPMRTRTLVLVGLAAVATTVHASFDLMLINEGNLVHRVDPVTRTYLGSFSTPFASAMTASFARKSLYLATGFGVDVWDYSTGEERPGRSFAVSSIVTSVAVSGDQSTLYVGQFNGTIAKFDAATSASTGTFATVASAQIQAIHGLPDGRVLALTGTTSGHTLRLYSSTGTQLSSVAVDSSSTAASSVLSLWTYTGSSDYIFFRGVNTGTSYNYVVLPKGTNSLGTVFGASSSGISSISGFEPGHVGGYTIGPDTTPANGVRVTRYSSSGEYLGSSVFSNIASASSTAIVLAPEPGTWAALGLGALALMRRRR